MRYSKLTIVNDRRIFDPKRKEDLIELKYFLDNDKWKKGCPFYLEEAWDNIPSMCKDKYTRLMLKSINKKPL
jgi:hypothetical protein